MYKSIFLCTFIILYTSVFWNTSIFCYLGKRLPNHKCEESRNLEVEACFSILIIMMTLKIPFFCMRCAIAVLLSISISMVKQWWWCANLSTTTFAVPICTFVNKLIVSSILTCFCGSVLGTRFVSNLKYILQACKFPCTMEGQFISSGHNPAN